MENYNKKTEITNMIADRFKLNREKVSKFLDSIDSDPMEAYFKVTKMKTVEIVSGVIAI